MTKLISKKTALPVICAIALLILCAISATSALANGADAVILAEEDAAVAEVNISGFVPDTQISFQAFYTAVAEDAAEQLDYFNQFTVYEDGGIDIIYLTNFDLTVGSKIKVIIGGFAADGATTITREITIGGIDDVNYDINRDGAVDYEDLAFIMYVYGARALELDPENGKDWISSIGWLTKPNPETGERLEVIYEEVDVKGDKVIDTLDILALIDRFSIDW